MGDFGEEGGLISYSTEGMMGGLSFSIEGLVEIIIFHWILSSSIE